MPDLIDTLFNNAHISVHAPLRLAPDADRGGGGGGGGRENHLSAKQPYWHAANATAGPSRERCFYDEDLDYMCDLQVAQQGPGGSVSREQFQQLVDHLEAKTECALVARSPGQGTASGRPFSRTPSGAGGTTAARTGSAALHPLSAMQAQQAAPPSHVQSNAGTGGYSALPPQTPNPSPMTSEQDTAYAHVPGQVIWEGRLAGDNNTEGSEDAGRPYVFPSADGEAWTARWKGTIPVHYVDNPLRRPRMAVTVVLTRRARGVRAEAAASPALGGTPRGEGLGGTEEHVTLGTLNNADVLSGLGGAPLPRQRIFADKMDRPSAQSGAGPDVSGYTLSAPLASSLSNTVAPEVARRSFRILLDVQSALNVRMRTSPAHAQAGAEGSGASRAPRSLSLELSVDDAEPVDFEVQGVEVAAGKVGAGGAVASGAAPGAGPVPLKSIGPELRVPLDVGAESIYQVLFSTDMSESDSLSSALSQPAGRDQLQVPLAIEVRGQPFRRGVAGGPRAYLAPPFLSRWNCMLDVGDQAQTPRTSLLVGQAKRPETSLRSGFSTGLAADKMADAPSSSQDIVVSFSILPDTKEDRATSTHPSGLQAVRPLKPFWVEAIVLNGTSREQSLKLAIPQSASAVSTPWPNNTLEAGLHAQLQRRADASSPIIHLENDVSTGTLAPRACEVVRMRFMALQAGLFSIKEVIIKGIDGSRNASLRDVLHVLVV